MEHAGRLLRKKREDLNLRVRDVYEASIRVATRLNNEEYEIHIGRLSDIENNGTVPSIYKLYTLCAIYRLDIVDVMEWYGVDITQIPAAAAGVELIKTHTVGFRSEGNGDVTLPIALDPGFDMKKTSFVSRMVQRWGKLPIMMLSGLEQPNYRYAYIGTEDWSMYPLIQPGSFVVIDEAKRKITTTGWTNEFDRPIYFFEHRQGYACGWCSLSEKQLVIQPHPASQCSPEVYTYPEEIDVLGQVTAVAMRLDQGRRRRKSSS
jgi:hypothetical protein